MTGRLGVFGLVVVLAGCPSEAPKPVESARADAGTPPKPVAAKPLPVRERGIASIGGKVVDALGSLVEAEVVLARRDEKPAIPRERAACEPDGLDDALDVLRERVTHERLESQKPDTRGRFVFKTLAPGSYVVWAETPTHRSASYPVDVVYLHAELGLVAVVPKRSMELTVTTTLGQPGRGLEAIVYDGSGRLATGRTDIDGKLAFPSLPLTGLGLLLSGNGVFATRFDVPDGISTVATQAVASGARSVKVTGPAGPVSGATVAVRGPRLGACAANTDGTGTAQFGSIPLDGTFAEAVSGALAGSTDLGELPTASVTLSESGTLVVSVVDEQKQPVPRARVAVFGAPGATRVARAGEDGTVAFAGLKRAEKRAVEGAAGADGFSAEMFSIPWKTGSIATSVKLRVARAVECRIELSPEQSMPEGRVVLRAVTKKKGEGEVLAMSLDGRTAWRDEVPSGEWTCGFEEALDGKVVATRPFKHPLVEDGSFVTLTVR